MADTREFLEGIAAGRAGLRSEDNPYHRYVIQSIDWLRGQDQGRRAGRAASNRYATDGKCHNSEPGTFNHECGRPATWLGTSVVTGFVSGFCDDCKVNGFEAVGRTWRRIDQPQAA